MDCGKPTTAQNIAFFIALLATALALGGALAHALELPNKVIMPRDHYFIVQRVYSGWDRLAYLLAIELAGIISVAWLYRDRPVVLSLALTALLCLFAAQVAFWVWTYPANQATSNWTNQPDGWKRLRDEWEYSHLVGALFQMLAMIALITAVLRRR